MMDAHARHSYEEWCRYHRKRKSEAGWELWKAAYKCGWSDKLPEFDQLPEDKQRYARALLQDLKDI